MTASHIQVLRAGPVQPIGLPPTAATMGVTNARVLHRRMLNNSQMSMNNNSLELLGARRCLFGAPEPGEIQNLYEEEVKRNRDRLIARYNFDILNDRFVGEGVPRIGGNPEIQEVTEPSPCTRPEEVVEDRLREDQSESSKATTTTKSVKSGSDCDTKCNLDEIQLLTITEDSCKATTATTVPVIDKRKIAPPPPPSPSVKDKKSCGRLKPYSRLITEYYNVRKTGSLQSIEVSQLPTPQKARLYVHEQQRFQACEEDI